MLLGVAYVDLSQMVFLDGSFSVSGYFHIVRKDRFLDGQSISLVDPHRMSIESMGQIKLAIQSNIDLKRAVNANPATRLIAKNNSPMNPRRLKEDQAFLSNQQQKIHH